MDKKKILTIVGIVATVAGAACFYLAGVSQASVGALVAGVFTLAGVIALILKG